MNDLQGDRVRFFFEANINFHKTKQKIIYMCYPYYNNNMHEMWMRTENLPHTTRSWTKAHLRYRKFKKVHNSLNQ